MKRHKIFGLYIAGLLVLLISCLLIWKPQPALADSPGSEINGTINYKRINANQIALCVNVTGGDSSSPTTVTVTLGSPSETIAAPHVATYPSDDSGCSLKGTTGGYLTAPFSGIPLQALPCSATSGSMVDDLTITAVNGKNSGTEQINLCPGVQGATLYKPATIALKTGSPPITVNVNATYTPYCPPTTADCPIQLLPLPSDVGPYFQAHLQLDNLNGTSDTSAPASGVINMTSTLATAGSNGIDATATVPISDSTTTEYTLSVALVKYPTPGVGTYTYNIDPNDNATFIFDASQTSPYPTISVNLISTGSLAVVTTPPPASTNQNSGTADPCESSGGSLSWIMCGIIDTVNSAENGLMTGVIQPLLQTKPLAFNADCSAAGSNCTSNDELGSVMYSVWSNFRVYGDVLLVIALLVIVFGEAIGGGLIDAYTAKKILPRILIAAILINLSIYIVAALEDVINVIGGGLDSLIRLPFENVADPQSAIHLHALAQAHVSGGVGVMGAVLFAIIAYGIFTGVAVPFLLFAAGALLLATIGVLVTLAIRQGLIIFLVLISPLAFALYCLPNTEQYFKKWWSLLVKTLLVYPIVMVVFAMSFVLGVVMTNFGVHPQMLADIMSLIAMVAPLFMIPFAFKMSGGIIGSVQGMVTNFKSRATKPMMGMAKQKSMENWQNAKLENRFKGGNDTNFRGKLNRAIGKSTQLGSIGYNPKNWKGNLAVSHDAITAQEVARNMKENAVYATFANDDSLNRAAAESNNATELRDNLLKADSEKPPEKRRYKLGASDPALNEDIRRVERVRRSMSAESFKQMTTQQALAGGTAFETTGDAWNLVRKATRGNDAARRRLVGAGRQILVGAGQGAQGGAAWSTVYNQLGEMDRLEVGKPGGLTPADLEHVSEVIEDSAAESLAPGQQVYNQKPDSAEKLAKAHARRAKKRIANYIDIAGQKPTTPEEKEQKAADLSLARRDAEYAIGTAMGIHDAQNQAAPQIAEKFATGLNGVDLITPEQIAALPESIKLGAEGSLLTDMLVQSRNFDGTMPTIKLDDTTGQLAAYVVRAVRDAEGKIAKDEDGNIVTRIEVEPITMDTLHVEERMRDTSENVARVRRDIGSRASAEAQRLMGGGAIPGAGGTSGEFVPPGGPAGPTPATPAGP